MRIGNREFKLDGNTFIMGILNVTPDSFSDGGSHDGLEQALCHAEEMIKQGVDIIDIGGESSRPGYQMISAEEEICRVLPVLKEIKEHFDIPVSVDTYKPKVAKAVLEEGADFINDIWGFRFPFGEDGACETDGSELARIVAKAGVPVCLTHNRADTEYDNFFEDVKKELEQSVRIARDAGVSAENIVIDPGIGFAKNYEQNLILLARLDEIKKLGYPVLLGASRKSVIGQTLGLPVSEREEGTIVTTVLAAMAGCNFVRVHDVEKNVRAVKMYAAVRSAARAK